MTVAGHDDLLKQLPGRVHFGWLLDRLGGVAGTVDPNEFEDHAMPVDPVKASRPTGMTWYQYTAARLCAAGHARPVAAVTGWRTNRAGGVVVTYTGTDGNDYDLTAQVDSATGRLVTPGVTRSTPRDVDIVYAHATQMSRDEYAKVAAVIRACYDDVDETWVQRRLGAGSHFAIAWRGDDVLGTQFGGVFEGDVPRHGTCRIGSGGLWVRPDARNLQLARALLERREVSGLGGPVDLALWSFASPLTFQMQFPGPCSWPGTTREGALHALATASDLVRNFTAQAAIAAGSISFDEQHWVAHGLEHGTPNTALRDIDPAITDLFRHVDQPKGDTLTIPATLGPPPAFFRT